MSCIASSVLWALSLSVMGFAEATPLVPKADFGAKRTSCPAPIVANTTYLGCYYDPVTPRTLSGASINTGTLNTPELCADSCAQAGYIYSGVEYTT
jgi:hypothetical protein